MAADTPRNLKLTTAGDLSIERGNLVVLRGADAITQAVRTALQLFRGEWFLDLDAGVPYFQSVLVKNPNASVLSSIFRKTILGVPGVRSLVSLDLQFDRSARSLAVTWSALTDVGLLGPDAVTVAAGGSV